MTSPAGQCWVECRAVVDIDLHVRGHTRASVPGRADLGRSAGRGVQLLRRAGCPLPARLCPRPFRRRSQGTEPRGHRDVRAPFGRHGSSSSGRSTTDCSSNSDWTDVVSRTPVSPRRRRTPAICWPRVTSAASPRVWQPCCPVTGSMPRLARPCLLAGRRTRATSAGSETYGGKEFAASVVEVLDLADQVGTVISPVERTGPIRITASPAAMSGCSGTLPGAQRGWPL